MSKGKRFAGLIPMLLVWAVISVFLWGFVFLQLTDTDAEHKIVIFADCTVNDRHALAVELEKAMPEEIRTVQARPFTYAMMGGSGLDTADIYLVPEKDIEQYSTWFAPLPDGWHGDRDRRETAGGAAAGLRIEPAETGPDARYIAWTDENGETDAYYLFFGASSVHTGSADSAAVTAAERLIELIENREGK